MESIKLNSHVGEDGVLQLQIPVSMKNTDLEVMVIIQPASSNSTVPKASEALGYSREFLEQVVGGWEEELLDRPTQLPYDERNPR